jgi:hypothetical protein
MNLGHWGYALEVEIESMACLSVFQSLSLLPSLQEVTGHIEEMIICSYHNVVCHYRTKQQSQ